MAARRAIQFRTSTDDEIRTLPHEAEEDWTIISREMDGSSVGARKRYVSHNDMARNRCKLGGKDSKDKDGERTQEKESAPSGFRRRSGGAGKGDRHGASRVMSRGRTPRRRPKNTSLLFTWLLPLPSPHLRLNFCSQFCSLSHTFNLAGNAVLRFPRHTVDQPTYTTDPHVFATRHRHPYRFKGESPCSPS